MDNRDALDLIRRTIEEFRRCQRGAKLLYLGEDYTVAFSTLEMLQAELLSSDELKKERMVLQSSVETLTSDDNYAMFFAEHCSFCIARLRILETKLTRFATNEPLMRQPEFSRLQINNAVSVLLCDRWEEAARCIECDSYLAAMILLGSILECILAYFVEDRTVDKASSTTGDSLDVRSRKASSWTSGRTLPE